MKGLGAGLSPAGFKPVRRLLRRCFEEGVSLLGEEKISHPGAIRSQHGHFLRAELLTLLRTESFMLRHRPLSQWWTRADGFRPS